MKKRNFENKHKKIHDWVCRGSVWKFSREGEDDCALDAAQKEIMVKKLNEMKGFCLTT